MAAADEKISIIRNGISISHCTRRITKIISCVQTGAHQTALDVVIEKEIAQLSETNRAGGQFWVVVSKGGSSVDPFIPSRWQKSTGNPG